MGIGGGLNAMQLLAISGSLRSTSSNSVLLRAAARLAPEGVSVQPEERMGLLPHFNLELDVPDVVAGLKRAVREADGVVFCTPEYVHGLPGSLKNLLDWLVSDGELWDKAVAVLSVKRTEFAEPQLREILRTLMARLCEKSSVLVPFSTNRMSVDEVLAQPELAEPLRLAVENFARFAHSQKLPS